MLKCSLTHTGNVDLLLLFCLVSLFAVRFTHKMRYNGSQRLHVTERVKEH